MPEPSAQRTLVKSPPELWAEVSDLEALARHLGEFGEIRITRVEPETTVAWEGDRARGTVALEPAGWGTRVTITAQRLDTGATPEPEPEPEPEPPADPEPVAQTPADAGEEPRRGWWARLFRRRPRTPAAEPVAEPESAAAPEPGTEPEPPAAPEPVAEPEPTATPDGFDEDRVVAILTGVLDDLGAAHHRPFSRG
jgi:hypothetical protein